MQNIYASLRLALAGVALSGLLGGFAPPLAADEAARIAAAKAAVKALAEGLRGELGRALKEGGPVAGIEACSIVAPQVAASVAEAHRLVIGRTALKVRNPANAPDAFERAQLEAFAVRLAKGEDPAMVEHAEVTADASGAKTLRYMKAIPMTAEPCLVCHGSDIPPAVKSAVAERYPADAAVGFAPGDLRGAFTVRMKID